MPAMRETWVQLLDREDPLEKETTTHSSVLAWRVPWTEEPGGLPSVGSQRVGHDSATVTFTMTIESGPGARYSGQGISCFCLPSDGANMLEAPGN